MKVTSISHKDEYIIKTRQDIFRIYSLIHKAYLSSISKPDKLLREWMSLISFIKKNTTRKCNTIKLPYPFTIFKTESPDFIIETKFGNRITIEVAKVTPHNWERLITLAYKFNKNSWESDPRLYDNSIKMTHKELMRLFRNPDDDLLGSPMYGDYKEKKWADICYKNIMAKMKKHYKIDVLLLDDQHINSSSISNIRKGLEFLKNNVKKDSIRINNIKTIISENQTGLILLFEDNEWYYKYKKQNNK